MTSAQNQQRIQLPWDGPLVFLHIQKTGGTSLHNVLRGFFSTQDTCPERLRNLQSYKPDDLTRYCYFSGHFDHSDIKYIPGPVNVISLFREPRSRILSHYYYWKSRRPEAIARRNLAGPRLARKFDLLSFLRLPEKGIWRNFDNHQVRMLLDNTYIGSDGRFLLPDDEVIPRALEFLDSMRGVGVLEEFDLSVRQIFQTLNLPAPEAMPHEKNHQSTKDCQKIEREELTEEIEKELDRLTRFDRQLYEHVRRRVLQIATRDHTVESHLV